MKVGTKSVLIGAHAFWLHGFVVALAWWKLYGFPFDPRLWVAFFVHDLGYIGKPNMDGDEGEQHPLLGARIMGALFGSRWYEFTLLHSRYFAKKLGKPFSRLCVADKLAFVVMPRWLYLPMVKLSGEVYEYMAINEARIQAGEPFTPEEAKMLTSRSLEAWHQGVKDYTLRWIDAHKSGEEDTFTPAQWRERKPT